MADDLKLIHAEPRRDYDIASAVRVYLRTTTGEIVIDERFGVEAPTPFSDLSCRTTISAAGARAIVAAVCPPPATEHHGPHEDERAATLRHGVG